MGGDARDNMDNSEKIGSETELLATATRIYVGGLGNAVTADDIRHTFSSLGNVKSVEIVRTKGRSLAYLDFLPSSPKSLAKLFSTYNGCAWKGGKLRLEKAKENYLLRLRKEWEDDAKLANSTPGSAVTAVETSDSPVKLNKSSLNLEKKDLRIFFPKLRSVELLPFKGSGKHKYSFQRIEVPSRPRHFCDCEEHSHLHPNPERKDVSILETQGGGIDEKELDIMNSVMKKLFERNNIKSAPALVGLVKEESSGVGSLDDLVNNGSETEQLSDEDNLVMNFVSGGKDKKSAAAENEEDLIDALKSSKVMSPLADEANTTTESIDNLPDEEEMDDTSDDDSLVMNFVSGGSKKTAVLGTKESKSSFRNEEVSLDEPHTAKDVSSVSVLKSQKDNKEPLQKKRKSPLVDGKEQAPVNPEKKGKAKKANLGKSKQEKCTSHELPQKTSWKDLIGGRSSNPSFSISHIFDEDSKPDGDSPISSHLKSQKNSNGPSQKKRKSPPLELTDEEEEKVILNLEGKGKGKAKAKKTHLGKSTQEASTDQALPQKSPWNDLVGETSNPQSTIFEEESNPGNIGEISIASHHQNQKPEEDAELPVQSISSEGPEEVANEPNAPADDKYARGDYWRQKSSWTQLITQNNSSFSITQILPGYAFEKLQHEEPVVVNALTSTVSQEKNPFKSGDFKASVNASGSSSGKDLPTSEETNDFAARKKEVVVKPKRVLAMRDQPIGETCTFMRSAASMKEWMSARAALSASLKKKEKQK